MILSATMVAAEAAALVVVLLVTVLTIIAWWRIFVKAGQPGWAILVPVYNQVVMLNIARKPTWWVILIVFVPIANIVVLIMMTVAIAKNFGKSLGFAIGMLLLPFIFLLILAFDDSEYIVVGNTADSAA